MKDALLFKTKMHSGKPHLDGLVYRMAVPIPFPADVLIYCGKLYVLHYEGCDEIYYREANVHHLQRNQILVDGRDFIPEGGDVPIF